MFYYKDESGKLGFFPVVASNFLLENFYNGDACILWCLSMFTVVLKAPQVTKKAQSSVIPFQNCLEDIAQALQRCCFAEHA